MVFMSFYERWLVPKFSFYDLLSTW